ncbi:hypothetical protein [Pedobacter sp. GR22-6]
MARKKSSSKKQQLKKSDTGATVAARSSSVSFPPVFSGIELSQSGRTDTI